MAQEWNRWIQYLQERMAKDFDNVILIDGYEGTGKSTLALHIIEALKPDWSPELNVAYNWRDMNRQLSFNAKNQAILLDEGATMLFSRDAMRRNNRYFGKLLFQIRQLNSTLIMCIPNKRWMDAIGREHRAQFWVHVHERGRATVLVRQENWRKGTVWYQDLFELGYGAYTGPKWEEYVEIKLDKLKEFGESEAPQSASDEIQQLEKELIGKHG